MDRNIAWRNPDLKDAGRREVLALASMGYRVVVEVDPYRLAPLRGGPRQEVDWSDPRTRASVMSRRPDGRFLSLADATYLITDDLCDSLDLLAPPLLFAEPPREAVDQHVHG